MQTKAAFEAIQRALSGDPRKTIVRSSFDEKVFGNFVIAFVEDGHAASLVNDRGQLLLYDGLDANEYRRTLLDNLHEADESALSEPSRRASFPPIAGVNDLRDISRMHNARHDRYIPPGTKVRRDRADEGPELGVVVHCWESADIGAHDCYVAFFGSAFPDGEPGKKPYILRYAATSLTVMDE